MSDSMLNDLAAVLSTTSAKSNALNSAALARFLTERGHPADERRVREFIAHNYRELSQKLGKILLAEAPAGYWLAGTDEEILHREQLLHALAKASIEKHFEYVALVRSYGLGAILPKRECHHCAASSTDNPSPADAEKGGSGE